MKLKKPVRIVFIVYVSLLLIASILPSFGELNKTKVELLFELRFDYFIHFCAYLGFYLLLIISRISSQTIFITYNFWKIFIITLFLATGTEIIQLFLSYRAFNQFDMLSNLSGIAIGVVIYPIYHMISKTTLKTQK